MGLYENRVLPRLLDLAMRNHLLDAYRRRAIESAHGLVLEIGIGSGLNLCLYGPGVGRVIGLDPSSELLRLARSRVAHSRIPVSLRSGSCSSPSTDFSARSTSATPLRTYIECALREEIDRIPAY